MLAPLVDAPPATLDEAQDVLIAPLKTTLRQVRSLLAAEQVSIGNLPAALKKTWMSTDGRVRMEVAPKGDGNDNAVLRRFVTAVRSVAPEAAGMPVFTIEAAASVVKAFLQAGVLSVLAIALILFVALRRWIDVALTLIPLLIAIVVTLEVCVLIGLPLNFANIIALPLLLGVGVAFKIYYIIAWRSGETKLPAIEPYARGLLQRLHDGYRLREPMVLSSPGHIEHGQADGAVAPDDARGRRHLPAGSARDAAEAPQSMKRHDRKS